MYGKEDATFEEIKRSAELANAANFIDKLPNVRETFNKLCKSKFSGLSRVLIKIYFSIVSGL
jgi:ATP-binding cassette subfamily B (MDR/TAP) protein 1